MRTAARVAAPGGLAPRFAATFAMLIAAGLLLAGCGGSSTPKPPGAAQKAPPPAAAHGKLIQDDGGDEEAVLENQRYELLADHFQRFTRRPASARKDMFKSHLDKYVEKIEIAATAVSGDDPEEHEVTKGKEEELDPLKKFPADEYKVVAIMTGVGTPAALLKDPKGNAYSIKVDTEVGNENGIVESITQYEIVIRNPAEPKPVRLSIRPDMFDISKRQEEDRAKEEEVMEEL